MTTQLTECARRAAEDVEKNGYACFVRHNECGGCSLQGECRDGMERTAGIIERYMRAWLAAEGKNAHNVDTLSERAEVLEHALTDAYAKLDEAKEILGKVL